MRSVPPEEESVHATGVVADMRPCQRCGHTDQHRMFALMTLWYGAFAGVPLHGGYFYLCPACYEQCIVPHLETDPADTADEELTPPDEHRASGPDTPEGPGA
jgi:hypothetical protein